MVQQVERPAQAAPVTPTRRNDIAVVFFGAWISIALYIDGWSHLNGKPETFFTTWHLMLYSGFAAAVLYFTWQEWKLRGTGTHSIDTWGMFGFGLFFVAGTGDLLWHSIFGIERDLATFVSPPHLGLFSAGIIIFSTTFRSAWRRPDDGSPSFRTFLPALLSLTLTMVVISFAVSYFSAFRLASLVSNANPVIEFLLQADVVSSVLVTNMVLLLPTLLVLRRWRPPPGSFTLLYSTVAIAIVALDSLRWTKLAIAGVVGGLVADSIVRWRRPASQRARARLIGVLVPALMWTTWVGMVHATWGVDWEADLVWGLVGLATLVSVALSLVVFPMELPMAAAEREADLSPPAGPP